MRSIPELCASYEADAVKARALAGGHAARGADPLAATVWSESMISYVMRAMFGWRAGRDDPRPWLQDAVDVAEVAVAHLASRPPWLRPADLVPAAFAAVLVGRLDSTAIPAVTDTPVPKGTTRSFGLEADAWLLRHLAGAAEGMDLRIGGDGSLRRRTAAMYAALLDAEDPADRAAHTREAVALYRERRRDRDFTRGPRWEGGADYNELLVDHRLAAIWASRGWPTAGLDPDVRIHLLPEPA